MKNQDRDYPYIRSYGWWRGSFQYYINDQVELAWEENAPDNAIYRDHDGTWRTTDDIINDDARVRMGLQPLPTDQLPQKYMVEMTMDLDDPSGGTTVTVRKSGRVLSSAAFTSMDGAYRLAADTVLLDQGLQQKEVKIN